VGAVYEVIPGLNAYAQFSKATDVIGNLQNLTAVQLGFNPPTGQQVEGGLKQSLMGGRIEWTLAGYEIVKKDLLVPDPLNVNNQIQVGQQSSRGVEGSIAFAVTEALRLEANGTVLMPRFDSFQEVVSGVSISRAGNRPTNVPTQSANLWATYAVNKDWLVQGGLRYVGNRYMDNANTAVLPAYTVLDASVRWNINRHLALDANGRGTGSWLVGAPRSFEISLTAAF
jgi:iron complex outermembrane receptor protein